MKKQVSLMMAAGLLVFASCNSGSTDNSASQAQIDSMVNARVESIRTEMMMKNDSIINAMAQMKADSIIAAMKGEKAPATSTRTVTHKTTHTTPTNQPTTDVPVTPTSSSKWNQGQTGTTSQSKWNQGNTDNNNNQQPTSKSKWGNKK